MKYLLSSFFVLLLFTHNASAGNLCDESCELTIVFSDGGSIEAVEALIITFGEGGLVNDGAATTGYSAGDTLLLAAGESLLFLSGGLFDLGINGNIAYNNISIADGNITLSANGGSEVVTIYNLTLLGESGFNLESNATVPEAAVLSFSGTYVTFNISEGLTLSVFGMLNIDGSTTIAGPGTVWVDTVNWPDLNDCDVATSSSTITVSGSGIAVVGNTSCAGSLIFANSIILSPLSGGVLTFTPSTITGEVGVFTTAPVIITNTDLTLSTESLTQEFLSLLPDGIKLDTNDGKTCTTDDGECVSATGVKYLVIDGKLEPEQSEDGSKSNGALGWFLFLVAFCLLCFRAITYNPSLKNKISHLIIE